MKISEIGEAIAEHDFARRAASYGGGLIASRHVLSNAILNLPSQELVNVRLAIQEACDAAVDRTTKRLGDLGIEVDVFPAPVRAAASEPK